MCLHPIYPTETGANVPRKTVGRALLLWSYVRRGVVDDLPFPGFRILRQVEVLLHAAAVHTCFCVVVRHIVFCTPSPCRPHARRTAERHPAPPQAFNVPVLLIVPWQQTKIRPPPAPLDAGYAGAEQGRGQPSRAPRQPDPRRQEPNSSQLLRHDRLQFERADFEMRKKEHPWRGAPSVTFCQHSLAPAGTLSSISIRCSFSSPFSLCTAEISMPQEGIPIIFRGGRFRMAMAVLPISCSGS